MELDKPKVVPASRRRFVTLLVSLPFVGTLFEEKAIASLPVKNLEVYETFAEMTEANKEEFLRKGFLTATVKTGYRGVVRSMYYWIESDFTYTATVIHGRPVYQIRSRSNRYRVVYASLGANKLVAELRKLRTVEWDARTVKGA